MHLLIAEYVRRKTEASSLAGGDDLSRRGPRTVLAERGEEQVPHSMETWRKAGLEPGQQQDIYGQYF